MRRSITFSILFFISISLLAQSARVTYRVSDTKATYEPVGKEFFYRGDSITVKQSSKFNIVRYSRVTKHKYNESQQIDGSTRGLSGTFEISELYAIAEQMKKENRSKAIGGKDFTPAAQTRVDKSLDESIIVVVSSLRAFLDQASNPIKDKSLIATQHDGIIEVLNSSGEDLFIDAIWVKDDRCFSAISYAKDYVSYYPLAANATRTIKVDRYANAETIIVVGTSVPVAYNTINFNDYQVPQSKGAITGFTIHIACANNQ